MGWKTWCPCANNYREWGKPVREPQGLTSTSRATCGKRRASLLSVRRFYTPVEVTFQTQRYKTVVGIKLTPCQIFKEHMQCHLEKSLGINPVVVLVRKLHGHY